MITCRETRLRQLIYIKVRSMTIPTKPIVDSISENVIFYQDRRTRRMKKQERERGGGGGRLGGRGYYKRDLLIFIIR